MKSPDTPAGIAVPITHVVAGLHIGSMTSTLPAVANIGSVLSVGDLAGTVPNKVIHRHLPLSYLNLDTDKLDVAVTWVMDAIASHRAVLVRSEMGRQRPGLVVAMAILRMGGYYHDAVSCVRAANPRALTDFRYLHLLMETDRGINARLRGQS